MSRIHLVALIVLMHLTDINSAGAQDNPLVQFTALAYFVQAQSEYGRDFDIIQERVKFDQSGFVDFGSIGGGCSQPLLEFPCTTDLDYCWISLLPRLVAVYPRSCFPKCVEWEAFGFKFKQDSVRRITIGQETVRAIAYLVQAPNGNIQLQLVNPNLGLVAFSDFHSSGQPGPHPVFLRDSVSREFFPFESNSAQINTMNYSGFENAYGIDWTEALSKRQVMLMREERLERVVAVNYQKDFPVPLRVRLDPQSATGYWLPDTPEDAVAQLGAMLPDYVAEGDTGLMAGECRLDSEGQLDEFRSACGARLCGRLPDDSRDPACSFFTRLVGWVEGAWLGGTCRHAGWAAETPLAVNLSERGLMSCHDMSSSVVDVLLTHLAGMPVSPERMIELYRERNDN